MLNLASRTRKSAADRQFFQPSKIGKSAIWFVRKVGWSEDSLILLNTIIRIEPITHLMEKLLNLSAVKFNLDAHCSITIHGIHTAMGSSRLQSLHEVGIRHTQVCRVRLVLGIELQLDEDGPLQFSLSLRIDSLMLGIDLQLAC